MTSKTFLLKPLAVAALFCAAGASQAALTVYTSAAAFAAATASPGVDNYTGFVITSSTPSPIVRSAGAYTYTASTPGNFYGGGTTADPFLSTNIANDSITFSGFTSTVRAIGGNFFGSDIFGFFEAGDVTVVATDSLGATSGPITITGATVSSFRGFVSTGSIASLVVTSVQPAPDFLWPTVDNLTLAVPEPGSYALMLAGLGIVAFMARRRSR